MFSMVFVMTVDIIKFNKSNAMGTLFLISLASFSVELVIIFNKCG